MSSDIRALMRSLAEDAPTVDNRIALADKAFSAGRRRSRVRHALVSSAAAVAALLLLGTTLFIGPSPLAAQYGTSGGTKVSGYPNHIGQQWPILDLPAKPGPIAGVLMDNVTWWAVAPSGHRWKIPGDDGAYFYLTSVSPDGRMIAYLSRDSDALVIHDLVTGKITKVRDIGTYNDTRSRYQMQIEVPAYISADDRYFAFSGSQGLNSGTIIVDIDQAKVTGLLPSSGQLIGWSGHNVVTSGDDLSVQPLSGGAARATKLRPSSPLAMGITNGNGVITSDGQQFAVLSGGGPTDLQKLTRFDLGSGAQLGGQVTVPPMSRFTGPTAGQLTSYTNSGGTSVVRVSADGRASTATTITESLQATGGFWATEAYDGQARPSLLLDRLDAWLLRWWGWLVFGGSLLALVASGFASHARRRRRRANSQPLRFGFDDSAFTAARWTARRKLVVGTIASVPILALLTGLTLLVFIPLSAPDLVTTQPVVWWSPIDAAQAKTGGVYGYPATVVPSRLGEQGFAVLVENHSSQNMTVSNADSADETPDERAGGPQVATTGGTAAQARSLAYAPSGNIPAHQARWVRQLATPHCVHSGNASSVTFVNLRVQIGAVTRTEQVGLHPIIGFEGGGKPGDGTGPC